MNDMNKDRYQKSFNTLHLSEDFREKCKADPEESGRSKIMKFRSIHGISRMAAAAIAACTIAIGSAGVCYACDIGGIRTKINLWISGENKEIEAVDQGDGSYVVYDENGEADFGFGGVAINDDGTTVPLSAQEIADQMNNECQLSFDDNGKKIFSYKSIVQDVTDLIDETGSIHIHVEDPSNPITYFDLTDINENGYSVRSDSEPAPGVTYLEFGL